MSKKDVQDYLTEGVYGTRLPKEEERRKYLGTLRERIVLALTIGQVMSDKGLQSLEDEMKNNKNGTKLLLNGRVSNRFLQQEKALANKYNIPYTIISDEDSDTNIGAVLTYDYAIDKEDIFIQDEEKIEVEDNEQKKDSFLTKIKNWFD